ncbi:MAG TPA: bifunctional cobalt-precorrin-7 (C(5))-methyltransferase/cobalt-precorrin-6B (C(15))-methyltransferase [Thalassospira lucentensis]|uniref:Bifunctional cobalt-precorrin-7 (C(5))-methyltransferase/cobalt-precorrin-6B (C(15))-methyltransferase n=1 Tax=Thalassospira lucentensis TaxID=168935 RepID=A0A3D5N9S1_9PROT|nr:precorrin-6y C5,15-methyltransferase (decarboxylating) subunit CbiE [Thalassospira lucentensis]HCW68189.1 bifunctional cobalt-precorrin-7 (C(5))-methyltransferase/cobalt-precorrin-6B (C(15))-methyltransferase [Thalassospira lucentensis]|tara:strand:- start:1850 stop:3103 length:1254 start_codon:yes stop_codon:yes gene_type:complete
MNEQAPLKGRITVIGIGEDGYDGLSPMARSILENARIIFGGTRHIAMLPGTNTATQNKWITPFEANLPMIEDCLDQNPVVLASGDPMYFGVGNTLIKYFGPEPIYAIPAPSSISIAASRLGWALSECDVITLHGRAPEGIRSHLRPHGKLIALSADGSTPALVAVMLCEAGFDQSRMTVCERLGGSEERITTQTAQTWQSTATSMPDVKPVDPLNLIMIDLQAGPKARPLPKGPGLPDDAFIHDGMITKSEIRAQTLSSLAPFDGGVLWDIGAGCGSVSIEWMRMGGVAVAIERDAERCAMIGKNAIRLGVPGIAVEEKSIEEALLFADRLPVPDAIFIGGGITHDGLLEKCWDVLPVHGRLVANTVTLEGEEKLLRFYNKMGGTLSRLSVSRLVPRGNFKGWSNLAPVTHYVGVKA